MKLSLLFWRILQIFKQSHCNPSSGWSRSEMLDFSALRIYARKGPRISAPHDHIAHLLNNAPESFEILDFGAISPTHSTGNLLEGVKRTASLKKMLSQTASNEKWGRFLLRLVEMKNGVNHLELGTNLGVGLLYLITGGRQNQRWWTLEGDPQTAALASQALTDKPFVIQKIGPFKQTLLPTLQQMKQVDFVFLDGHHDGLATIQYFKTILPYCNQSAWLVLDDIRWSPSMFSAWEELKYHPSVLRWVDFGKMGLLEVK